MNTVNMTVIGSPAGNGGGTGGGEVEKGVTGLSVIEGKLCVTYKEQER